MVPLAQVWYFLVLIKARPKLGMRGEGRRLQQRSVQCSDYTEGWKNSNCYSLSTQLFTMIKQWVSEI